MKEKKKLPAEWAELSASEFIQKWYKEQYQTCTYCNAAGVSQKIMHKSIEKNHRSKKYFDSVLEIGANRGEHLQFVRHGFRSYVLTDINNFDIVDLSPTEQRKGLKFQVEDACSLSFSSEYFDRVLCSCVLHHVLDAESALLELRRVLKKIW